MKFFHNEDVSLSAISNFFHTFGFFSVGGIVDAAQRQSMSVAAADIAISRRKRKLSEIPLNEGFFEGSICEEFSLASDLFFSDLVSKYIQSSLGSNFIYLGSDFSVFSALKTQSWHRDWWLGLPVMKVGYYLNTSLDGLGGELRVIPGSQRIGDSYSAEIQRALAWPAKKTRVGGLNERDFFPLNYDYSCISGSLDVRHISLNAGESSPGVVPHVSISVVDPTQIVCFDPRIIHSGTVSLPLRRRIMFSALFCPNPFDETFDPAARGISQSRGELAKSLLQTLVLDRIVHSTIHTYHKEGLRPKLSSNHLIDLRISSDSAAITFAQGQTIEMSLDGIYESPGGTVQEKVWSFLAKISRGGALV